MPGPLVLAANSLREQHFAANLIVSPRLLGGALRRLCPPATFLTMEAG